LPFTTVALGRGQYFSKCLLWQHQHFFGNSLVTNYSVTFSKLVCKNPIWWMCRKLCIYPVWATQWVWKNNFCLFHPLASILNAVFCNIPECFYWQLLCSSMTDPSHLNTFNKLMKHKHDLQKLATYIRQNFTLLIHIFVFIVKCLFLQELASARCEGWLYRKCFKRCFRYDWR
jgi:hypothetical protein